MKFKSYIEVQSGIKDSADSPGTLDQVLTSTATGVAWVDPSTISAEAATLVVIECKNTSGATIIKGTPVYQTGTVGATDVIEIAPADALISAGSQPAIGLLQTTLNNNGFGKVVITGEFLNFTTDPIDGVTPVTGQKVFLKSGGGLTLTKPTGAENGIQNLGLIGKVSGGNAGSITVSSIMRTNDVPNLPTGKIWVGDGNTIVSDTVFLDEPNGRMGIGTTSPQALLHLTGTVNTDNTKLYLTENTDLLGGYFKYDGNLNVNYIGGLDTTERAVISFPRAGNTLNLITNNSIALHIDASRNVGIGTTSPGQKLDVRDGTITSRDSGNVNYAELDRFSGLTLKGNGAGVKYVSTPNTDALGFKTNNSEKMRIDANGTIFIGNQSTAYQTVFLDPTPGTVYGNGTIQISPLTSPGSGVAQFTTNFADRVGGGTTKHNIRVGGAAQMQTGITEGIHYVGTGVEHWGDGGTGMSFPANDTVSLRTASSDRLYINSLGNVGIGTTSPGYTLAAYANTTGSKVVASFGSALDQNEFAAIGLSGFIASNGATKAGIALKRTGVYGTGELHFLNNNTLDNSDITLSDSKMMIDDTGNVGIGTTSPGAKLDVAATTNAVIRLTSTGDGLGANTALGSLQFYGNDASVPGAGVKSSIVAKTEATLGDDSNLIFSTSDGTTNDVERMRITAGGVLMVGGTTGGYAGTKIHVGNFTDTQNGINVLSSTTGYGYLLFGDGTGADTYRGQITYYHGDDSMIFNTNGSEKLRIVSGGGISFAGATNFGSAGQVLKSNGSASPAWVDASTVIGGPYLPLEAGSSYPLTGTLYIGNVGGDQKIQFQRTGGNVYSIEHDSAQLYFYNRTTTEAPLVIQNDGDVLMNAGNVGIGTTSPSTKLHIVQPGGSSQLTLERTGGGAGKAVLAGAAEGLIVYDELYGAKMYVGTSGTYNGNVGIGTTAPSAKLEVTGSVGSFKTTGHQIFLTRNGNNEIYAVGASSVLALGQNNAEKMRIHSNGNVGIGTTTPTAPLHIEGGTNSEVLKIEADANPYIRWVQNGTDVGFLQFNGGSAYLSNMANGSLFFRTNNTDKMTILSGGNVGIGTTAPSQKLHVAGNMRLQNQLYDSTNSAGTNGEVLTKVSAGTEWKVPAVNAQMPDNTAPASAANVGTIRYRSTSNTSFMDMSMQTGATTYAWVNIVSNFW